MRLIPTGRKPAAREILRRCMRSLNSVLDQPIDRDRNPRQHDRHGDSLGSPVETGLPLPTGSAFYGMIRYKHGIGVDLYQFTAPTMSIDEFLDYYRNLPPTEGWTVTHVGHVNLHQDDCELTRGMRDHQ